MPQFESMPILERNSLYNKMWTLRGNAFLIEVLQEAREEKNSGIIQITEASAQST